MTRSFLDPLRRVFAISWRELRGYARTPLVVFSLLVAPIVTIIFFTTLMWEGLPTDLPVAVVDQDNTQVTRSFLRTVDALQQTQIVARYNDFGEARKALQRGEIYAIFYIPRGTTEKAIASRQPQISFYTNELYYIPAALVMKDLRMASELLGISITRESLYGRGLTPEQAMGVVQPIVIEKHAMGNPRLNYSIFLCNEILPGILMILTMLSASYLIGLEWKRGTQRRLYREAGCSQTVALIGKMLPLTLCYQFFIVAMDVYFYRILDFPCHCSIWMMMLWGCLGILASQAMAVFIFGIFAGQMRFSMSVCSLLGIVSISMAGFSFPVSAMHPVLQPFCNIFPLRHYFLIYANSALNGYPLAYVWTSIVALLLFLLLPLLVIHRYRWAFLRAKYKA